MLDFLHEHASSVRRQRAGVYASYDIGASPYRVRVVLMDCRWFKGDAPDGDILGEEQWLWLEDKLTKVDDSVALVALVSSIQVINGRSFNSENWPQWPRAHARLYDLLNRETTLPVVVLSGDRHYGEIAVDCAARADAGGLVEVTSSGMTHNHLASWAIFDCNDHRVSRLVNEPNFATLDLDWDRQWATVRVLDRFGHPVIEHGVSLCGSRTGTDCRASSSTTCVDGTPRLAQRLPARGMCGPAFMALLICVVLCIPLLLLLAIRARI